MQHEKLRKLIDILSEMYDEEEPSQHDHDVPDHREKKDIKKKDEPEIKIDPEKLNQEYFKLALQHSKNSYFPKDHEISASKHVNKDVVNVYTLYPLKNVPPVALYRAYKNFLNKFTPERQFRYGYVTLVEEAFKEFEESKDYSDGVVLNDVCSKAILKLFKSILEHNVRTKDRELNELADLVYSLIGPKENNHVNIILDPSMIMARITSKGVELVLKNPF